MKIEKTKGLSSDFHFPMEIEIKIESEDDLLYLWHVFKFTANDLDTTIKRHADYKNALRFPYIYGMHHVLLEIENFTKNKNLTCQFYDHEKVCPDNINGV